MGVPLGGYFCGLDVTKGSVSGVFKKGVGGVADLGLRVGCHKGGVSGVFKSVLGVLQTWA